MGDPPRISLTVYPGLDYIAWGLLCFLVAMLISLIKTGLPQRWLARRPKPEGEPQSAG